MRDWESQLISEADFFSVWGAYAKQGSDMFFFDDVRDKPLNHVWTVTDSGGGKPDHWIASPGFRIVNVLGYVMTRKPWSGETPDAFYSFDDFDWEDDGIDELEGN